MTHRHFRLDLVRRVWRFEDLPAVWPEIVYYASMEFGTSMPYLREDYKRAVLTQDEERAVRLRYHKDVERFRYA